MDSLDKKTAEQTIKNALAPTAPHGLRNSAMGSLPVRGRASKKLFDRVCRYCAQVSFGLIAVTAGLVLMYVVFGLLGHSVVSFFPTLHQGIASGSLMEYGLKEFSIGLGFILSAIVFSVLITLFFMVVSDLGRFVARLANRKA